MKQFLLFLFLACVGFINAQQPQMLRVPVGSGYTFINLDEVKSAKAIGENETRIRTTKRTYYTVTESFDNFMLRSGHCKLVQLETQAGNTVAIPYASIDRINDLSDDLGIVQLKDKPSFYSITNMQAVRDSILYAQCGHSLATTAIPFQVDSVTIDFDSTYSSQDNYIVNVYTSGVQVNQIDQINTIYEEPFEGGTPLETEVACMAIGGGVFRGAVAFDEASTGDVIGSTYLTLTDMIDTNGDPIGTQQEFDVVPRN